VFADLLESDEGYVLVVDLPPAPPPPTPRSSRRTAESSSRDAVRRRSPTGFRYVREDRPLFLDAELPLPSDADGSGADAEMDRGVLEMTIPKRTDGASRTIPVDEAGDDEADA